MYGAELLLTKALPQLEKAATSQDLAMAFADHLQVTKNQIAKLEQVFQLLDKAPEAKKYEGMEGLIKEGQSMINDTEGGTSTRDVGLIISAQMELTARSMPKDRTTFAPETCLASFSEQNESTFKEVPGRLSIILTPPEKFLNMAKENSLQKPSKH